MSIDAAILAINGLVVLVALYLRTNIALATLALGIGFTLADLTTDSIASLLVRSGISTSWPLNSIAAISLTMLPTVLILYRFRRFQRGRFFEHIFPAIFMSLLATVLIIRNLPFDLQQRLDDESYVFSQIEYFRTSIVVGAAVIAIFDLMVHEQKLRKKAKRRKNLSD
ncbi:MAG TPA: hypothetical protein VGA08_02940 [Candidatus Saccharimonadales bacterium]